MAEFIGSPAMNLVEAELGRDDGALVARFGEHRLRLADSLVAARPAITSYVGRRVALGMRPEDLEDAALVPGAPEDETFEAESSTSARTWARRSTSTSPSPPSR